MDIEKSKAFLLKLAVVYWALVILIYIAAYPQFRYKGITTSAPVGIEVVGEIVDGQEIRQSVTLPAGILNSLSLMTATYDRQNTGEVFFSLEDGAGETVALGSFPVSDALDNAYTTIALSEPLQSTGERRASLVIRTQGCVPGNAIAFYVGNEMEEQETGVDASEYALYNGEVVPGALCVRFSGALERCFYKTYWVIVLAVFLVGGALSLLWWRQALQGKDNPLVMVCTLATRYSLLFRQLVSRDFKTKYKRSVLGMLWSFLNPLLMMSVQYVVFSTLFKSNIDNYPVYLLTGIVFFNFFNEAVSLGMTSITSNAALIKKVYVPKYIYPISRVTSSTINFFLAMIPLVLVMLITGAGLHLSLLLLVFDILCFMAFITGMSLLLSTSMTFFQDTQFLWNIVSMIWMYMTPIFYPETIIPQGMLPCYRLNPLYQFITFARICIISGVSPEPMLYLNCILSAGIVMLLGTLVFKKYQDQFVLYM